MPTKNALGYILGALKNHMVQGCQMIYFQTKNPIGANFVGFRFENVDIFYGHLEYFTDIWNILRTFGIFYGHSGNFMTVWYIWC
jgi:hypothetical protein